jgi:DnaA-homolog protein
VATQLTLAIALSDGASFANYHPGPNREALDGLQHALHAWAEPFIYLWGGVGVGKTHLLLAACRGASSGGRSAAYLPLGHGELVPDALEGMEGVKLVAVDDVETRARQPEWETALFHLYNRLRERGTCLLMTGREPPSALGLDLPDLRSRLAWGIAFHLQPLCDTDKLAALRLRARGRGLELPDEVGRFLLRRYPRDMAAMFALLESLDQASLATRRRLTVPFVKSVLNR